MTAKQSDGMFFLANPKDQEHLVGRRFYLDKLSEYARQGRNTVLLGPQKSGKTSLVKELALRMKNSDGLLPVYLGLNRTSTPPENFSIELVGGVCFWFLGAISSSFSFSDALKFSSIEHLSSIKEKLGKGASAVIETLQNEVQKVKPDQKLMLKSALGFAEEVSKKSGKRIVIIFDDFENMLDLENFSQTRDFLSMIDFKSKNVTYIATSSSSTKIKSVLREKNFTFEELALFAEDETEKLVEGIAGKKGKKTISEIHSYCHGIPVLIKAVSYRLKDSDDVKKAYMQELICKNSQSHHYLESVLGDFLHRARGESMPKTLVKQLAFMKNARLTQISKKIYRSAPVTKSILERIMQVDLVVKIENHYEFSNPALKEWLMLSYCGFECEETPSDEIVKKAWEVLDEQQ